MRDDHDDGRMLCRRHCPVCRARETRLEVLARVAGIRPDELRGALRGALQERERETARR
jgi:hypothetical protein